MEGPVDSRDRHHLPPSSPVLRLLLAFTLSACATARVTATGPAPVIVTYTESEAAIVNPARGLYLPIDWPAQTDFGDVRLNGYSLTHSSVRLDA